MTTESGLKLTVAIGHRYDSRYLRNRIVGIEGFDVDFPVIPSRGEGEGSERMVAPGEPYMAPSGIFNAMAADPPYDIGEQAFSTYVQAVARGDDVTALPVFPSRFFPHVQLCVRADSDIGSPADLIGKRFALGSFSINFGIWLRGVLDHQYGVDTTAITWVTSRDEYFGFTPPERFAVERAPKGATALSLLREGAVDALAMPWAAAQATGSGVRLMLDDPYAQIAAYCQENPIFPINTVVMMPRRTLRDHAGFAAAVLRAYQRALTVYRDEVRRGIVESDELGGVSLFELEKATGIFLPDHGLEPNRQCIETMVQYCLEQGIIGRRLRAEELFETAGLTEPAGV